MNTLDYVELEAPSIKNGTLDHSVLNDCSINQGTILDPIISGGMVVGGGMNSGLTISNNSIITFSMLDENGETEYIELTAQTIKDILQIIDIVKEQNPQHFV